MRMSPTEEPKARATVPSPAGGVRPDRPASGGSATPPGGPARMPPRRMWLWFLLILVAHFVATRLLGPGGEPSVTVPYTLFKEEVSKGNVEAIYSRGDTLTGRFKTAVTWPPPGEKGPLPKAERGPPKTARSFASTLPAFVDPGLEKFLIDNHVEISARPIEEERSPLLTLLVGFGPALILIGLYVWMFRRAARQGGGLGGLMGIGKRKGAPADTAR